MIRKLFAFLAFVGLAATPMAGWAASATYDGTLTVNAWSQGGGTVAVSQDATAGEYGESKSSSYQQTASAISSILLPGSKSFTFYAFAKPAEGYKFAGWFPADACEGSPESDVADGYTVTFSVNKNSSDTKTYYAKFVSAASKVDIADAEITLNPSSANYTGSAQTTAVTVKYGTTTLTENTDYTVSGDVTATGSMSEDKTYAVTITAMGDDYEGSVEKTWTIKAPSGSFDADALSTTASGCTASGDAVTVTESTALAYDSSKQVWTASMTITWPHKMKTSTAIVTWNSGVEYYMDAANARIVIDAETIAGSDTLNGGKTGEGWTLTGVNGEEKYGTTALNLNKTCTFFSNLTYAVELTVDKIKAAKEAGSLSFPITVYGLAWDGMSSGIAPKTFTLTVPIDENLVLNDENGDEVYPNPHKHMWGDFAASGDTFTATCTNRNTECSEGNAITLTLKAEGYDYDGKAPTVSLDGKDDFNQYLKERISYGTITYEKPAYSQGEQWYTGDYTAVVTVTVDSVNYELTKAFTITKPAAGYTDGFEAQGVGGLDVRFNTFAEAAGAAGTGATIYYRGGNLNAATITFSAGKDITLDLGGKVLSYNQNATMTIRNDGAGKVTFVNGTIKQPKGPVNAAHITLTGSNGGAMAFGEGISFVNQASNDNNYLKVTADGIAVEIIGGLYQAGFATKNGGSVVIKGGDFWENDNPSEFLVEGFAIGQSTVEGYRYRVIAHTHALVYAVNGNVITLTCTGTPNTAECFYNKADVKLTLVADDAKEDKDGKPYAAKLGIHDAFEPKVTADAITYWQGGAQLAVAPSAIGEYEARITVEDVTAVKAFRILDRARTFDVSKISVTGAGDAACYELAGTTLTVTNGGWKYYAANKAPDGSGIEGWYAGLTVTWPNEAFSISGFNFTGPKYAKFTVNGIKGADEQKRIFCGTNDIPGVAVKTDGFNLLGIDLTQVTSFTWYERITVADVKAATKAGDATIERQVTAWGEKWSEKASLVTYGDTDGVSNTMFRIVADLKDLELWDDAGYKLWPEHEHEWSYVSNENSITAKCDIVEEPCRYSGYPVWAKIVPTDKAEKLCDQAPLTAWVENGVTFAGATDATVGEVEYWQGSKKLDDAPTQPGVYTAKATVTLKDGVTTYELKTTLTIRAGQVVVDGKHYEKAEDQLERKYALAITILNPNDFTEPLYISLGKDFAAERTYTIPDATLDIFDLLPMKTLDLAGFTVTGAVNAAIIDNKGKLTICDSSNAGTGTLMLAPASDSATPLLLNEKGATLMIDGGTFLGAISNQQGTVVITAGKFLYEPEADWLDDGSYVRRETVGGRQLYVVRGHEHSYTFLQLGSLLSATCTARDQGQGLFEGSSCKAKEVLMVVTMASKDFDGKPMYEVKESGGSWLDDLKDMIGSWIGGSGIQNLNPYVNYVNVTSLVGSMGITEFIQGLSGGIDGLLKELFETKKETFLSQAKFESMTGAEIKDIYFTQEPDGSWFSQLLGLSKETRLDAPPTNAGTYNFCVDVEAKRLISILGEKTYTLKQQFTINARPISDTTVALTPNSTNLTYTGQNQAYGIKVQLPSEWGIIDILGLGKTTLVEGEDYTISGTTNATAVGSYSFVVTGIGNYTGSQTINWQISAPTREFGNKPAAAVSSERGVYAAVDGTVITVSNSSNLMYDASADAWNLGLVVTWPDGNNKQTAPADAYVKLSTQEGKTYTGADILGGQTDGEELTLAKTGSGYVDSVTWNVQITTNDVEAAIAAGEPALVFTLTAGANASTTDPQGLKETEFTLVVPVAGIRLYDNGGKRIYPEHLHDWKFSQDNEDELTVTCVSEEPGCSVPEEGFTLVLRPVSEDLEYDGSPKVCVVDQPDGFAPLVGASVGEVAYSQAGVPLAGAPSLRGEYVATATVSYGGETYVLTKNFEILRPEGGYVDGFEVWSTHDRYDTLPEAIAAAAAEDTVICCAGNASFTDLSVELGDKDLTLDLNGKTWSNAQGAITLAAVGAGTLTLTNGTIQQPTSRSLFSTTYYHLTITGGKVVFGEGLKLVSQWTSATSNRSRLFTVTANVGSALDIVDGAYQCNFVATGDNLVITGGRFWANFDPSAYLPEGYFVRNLSSGSYQYEVALHQHVYSYTVVDQTIYCACTGEGESACAHDAANCFVKLIATNVVYTGSAVEAVVEYGSVAFPTNVVVEYLSKSGQVLVGAPTDVGSYTARLTAGGKSVSQAFTIGAAAIDGISLVKSEFEYNGLTKFIELLPVTASAGTLTLVEGVDYEVSGVTNAVGRYYRTVNYTVTVTAKGNFSGKKTCTWSIVVLTPVAGFYLPEEDYELVAGVPIDEIVGDASEMTLTSVTVKNLPTGLSLKNRTVNGVKEYYLTGTPTKAWDGDEKPTIFTAKDSGTYKKTGVVTTNRFFVTMPEVVLTTDPDPYDAGCKVTGSGSYVANKKVTLKATAAKGWVFAGWYTDSHFAQGSEYVDPSGLDYRKPSLSIVVPAEGVELHARFVPVSEDYCQDIAVPLNGAGVPEGKLTVDSLSLPTITVSGLPTGVTFDKNTSVFTVNEAKFKGASAAVTVSVKNAGGYQNACVIAERDDIGDCLAVGQVIDVALDEEGWFTDETGKDTLAASGLPTGLKLVKTSALVGGLVVNRYSLQGLLTKAGRFTVKWTITRYTESNGKLVKDTANSGTQQTVMVVQGAPSRYVALPIVVDESGTTGSKLTGGNVVVAASGSVKTGATAAKNAVFAGWYDGDEMPVDNLYQEFLGKDGDYRLASQTWVHGSMDGESLLPEALQGRFVAKADDTVFADDIEVLELDDSDVTGADVGEVWNVLIDEGETHIWLDNACRRVAVAAPSSYSAPKITVKGLPSGLTSKIYGTTAIFSYDPTGKSLPKPGEYTVTITVKNQSSAQAVRTLLVCVPNTCSEVLANLNGGIEGAFGPLVVKEAIEDIDATEFLASGYKESGATIKSISGLPSGLKFTAKTGLITGTPTKVGLSVITVTASYVEFDEAKGKDVTKTATATAFVRVVEGE